MSYQQLKLVGQNSSRTYRRANGTIGTTEATLARVTALTGSLPRLSLPEAVCRSKERSIPSLVARIFELPCFCIHLGVADPLAFATES